MTIHIMLNIMNIQSIKDKDTKSLQTGKERSHLNQKALEFSKAALNCDFDILRFPTF